ncbi:MAG: alpha/beta hydrolase, partial [Lachnospiraceae bacterium]|nr:alpha/beta hydrolase [Lachnospiraceae bacterium]
MPYISPDQYDTQFYYEDKGSGQPVVFAHGWSGSSRRFAEIARPLLDTGKFRIIVYDQRGHGASKGCEKGLSMEQLGRDLHTIIQALELKDVILAGHSMGAMTIYS